MSASFEHFHQNIKNLLNEHRHQDTWHALRGALSHPSLTRDAHTWLGVLGLQTQQQSLAQAALGSLALGSDDPHTLALLTRALPEASRLAAASEAYRTAPTNHNALLGLLNAQHHAGQHEAQARLLTRHAPHIRTPAALASLAAFYHHSHGAICGAVWQQSGQLQGWCLVSGSTQPPTLGLALGGARHHIRLKRSQSLDTSSGQPPRHAWWFNLALESENASALSINMLTAWLEHPELASQAMIGAPLRWQPQAAMTHAAKSGANNHTSQTLDKKKQTPDVSVLVPVYEGLDETLACLKSVLASQADNITPFRLVVVNDASPNTALVTALQSMATQQQLALHHQTHNQGFIGTVNHGLDRCAGDDVILLNADTLVHGNWVDRLHGVAYHSTTTASVTPLTNNGELMSLLAPCEPAPPLTPEDLHALDDAARHANTTSSERSVTINTGCGFCLYLRHDALAEIGGLDPTLIRGYGEESDWCYRAAARGWQHKGALDVVIAHQGGVSFGDEKRLRVKQNLAVLEKRYPQSERDFTACLRRDPMQAGRQRLWRHWLRQQSLTALWPESPAVLPASLSVWPSLAQAMRMARQDGAALCATQNRLTLHGNTPHPWRLDYTLPDDKTALLADLNALGVSSLRPTTPALSRQLEGNLPEFLSEQAKATPAQRTLMPAISPEPMPHSGLIALACQAESLSNPAFIQWVSELAREQRSLYLLSLAPISAHHPLAASGHLFYWPLTVSRRTERVALLRQHLPLAGIVLLDDAPASQADAHWLLAANPTPLWLAPGITPDALHESGATSAIHTLAALSGTVNTHATGHPA